MQAYLDNSATTRQFDEVTDLMTRMMKEDYGNPSSLHHMGLVAEKAVKEARKNIADAAGVRPENVYFTSGGTESDNTAIIGAAHSRKRQGKRIITTKIEHPAVLESFKRLEEEGFEAVYVDVSSDGIVDMDMMRESITDDTILIACMHVNNETGAVQPVEEIAAMKGRALMHVDAVQSFGKIALPHKGVDTIAVSGHKIHGPKGTGALIVSDGVNIKPFIVGGGQERNFRSGTENTPGIAGLGLAAKMVTEDLEGRYKMLDALRSRLFDGLKQIDDILVNSNEDSCPAVLNISFLGTRGEVILHTLETSGVYVSTGSACSSHHGGGSHVLKAMGLTDKQIDGAIRFSLSAENTPEEMDYAAEMTAKAVSSFRRLGSLR